jgi:LacI family transcriptional regulator
MGSLAVSSAGLQVAANGLGSAPTPNGELVPEISTVRDVAELARVSLGTVSNYLNGTKPVAARTRERIELAIRQLNFVPNSAGRIVRGGRSHAIGFVVPDAPDPYFAEVARGIEDVAREAGHVLIACNTNGVFEYELTYVRTLAEMRVLGGIIMPTASGTLRHLDQLRSSGAAIVLLGTDPDEFDACTVTLDDFEGGRLAMQHLTALGHRDLLFVGGPGGDRQIRDRIAGARHAMENAGLDPNSLQRVDAMGASIAARSEVGTRIARMTPRPTGVFCANDSIALAVQGRLQRLGLNIPDDVAIVGFNNIEQTELAAVPVTTVATPQYDMGAGAARLLIDEAEDNHSHKRLVFAPSLIARASTLGSSTA